MTSGLFQCTLLCQIFGKLSSFRPFASHISVTGLFADLATGTGAELPAAFSERQPDRKQMVDSQLKGWGRTPTSDAAVLQAMLKVPRHLFVPPNHSALGVPGFPRAYRSWSDHLSACTSLRS